MSRVTFIRLPAAQAVSLARRQLQPANAPSWSASNALRVLALDGSGLILTGIGACRSLIHRPPHALGLRPPPLKLRGRSRSWPRRRRLRDATVALGRLVGCSRAYALRPISRSGRGPACGAIAAPRFGTSGLLPTAPHNEAIIWPRMRGVKPDCAECRARPVIALGILKLVTLGAPASGGHPLSER